MKLRSLFLMWMIGLCASAWAQEVDVATAMADTKTFIFDDNKSTVKGYIYAELEAKTSCCGEDRIYLEIKIDPSGYVLSVKPLTGKSECYKQAAMDIVKNVRWNAADFKGPKSVYFEIKPNIGCQDDRTNEYVPVPISNNPMLNPEGTDAPKVAVETESDPLDEQVKQNLIAATQGSDAVEEQPEKTEPAQEQIAMEERQIREGTFQAEPAETELTPEPEEEPQQTLPEPRVAEQQPEPTDQGTPRGDEGTQTNPQLTSAEEEARLQEIELLRGQLEKARAAEEKRLAELKRREEARRQREAAAAEAAAAEADEFGALPAEDGGSSDEIWVPDDGNSGGDEGFDGGLEGGDGDDDRLIAEAEELREQQRQLRDRIQQLVDDQNRINEETRAANAEILQLEQEIAAREEEAEQYREQKELEDLQIEQEQIAEQSAAEEEEYQRMQEEIRRLEEEAAMKIQELAARKQEMERLAQIRAARQVEINKARQLRELERQQRIAEMRISLSQGGATPIALGGDAQPLANADAIIESLDLTAEADSEAVRQLAEMIAQMRLEIAALQNQIIGLGGDIATTPQTTISGDQITPGAPVKAGQTPRGTTSGGVKSAAADDSWKNIEIRQPGVDPNIYGPAGSPTRGGSQGNPAGSNPSASTGGDAGTRAPQPTEFDKNRGYTNAVEEEHANVAGPKGTKRTYIDGEQAMKDMISARLRQGKVCGLAQALFSLTLDPQGNVVRHSVLTANTATVQLQLSQILPTLKFSQADIRINQTIYLEFKADISCEGQDRVNLQNVDPIINDN